MERRLTEQDGRTALRDHVVEKAAVARARYGPMIDSDAICRVLDDREIVRYPTGLRFDAGPLRAGEFAYAAPLGEHPRQGYCLFVHPWFEPRKDRWAPLIAYHIPPINYGDIAAEDDCEAFGAALLGMEQEEYYRLLCELADSIPAPTGQKGTEP